MPTKKVKRISGKEFDRLFDEGSDKIDDYIDWSKGHHPNLELKRVNVDLPVWVINALDKKAARIGVPRMGVIKTCLAELAEQEHHRAGEAA